MSVADDPAEPNRGGLRASDEDRERAAALLRDHCAAGRLTADELDERLGAAYRARTLGELDALQHDLPGPLVPSPSQRTPGPWRGVRLPAAVLAIGALVAMLALATGAHGAWLIWPLAFVWLRRGRCGRWRGPVPQGRTPSAPRWL